MSSKGKLPSSAPFPVVAEGERAEEVLRTPLTRLEIEAEGGAPIKVGAEVQGFLDALPFYVMLVDAAHHILLVNQAVRRDLGLDPERIVGGYCPKVVHGLDGPFPGCPLEEAVEKGHGVERESFDSRYERWVSSAVYPTRYRTEEGRVVFIHFARDITELKQAQEKLRHAAGEWRQTFDAISDLVSIHDKDFKIVRVNKAYASAFKMKPQELIGKTCYEVVHGTREPWPDCPHKRVLETKRAATAQFFEPRLGIHLEVSVSPIFNDKGEVTGTVHLAKDITERKQAEEEISRLARFPSENPCPILRVAKDGTLLYANQASSPLLNTWKCQVGQILPSYWREFVANVFTSGSQEEAEVDYDDCTLSLVFAPIAEANYVNIYGIDITERKRVEGALRESEEKFYKAFHSSPSPTAIITLADGRFIDINDSFIGTMGYRREEVIGHTVVEVGTWVKEGDNYRVAQMLREHGTIRDMETEVCTKSGKPIVGLFSAEIINLNGEECVITAVNDITERKEAEELYRSLANSSPTGIFIAQEGKFVFVNPQFQKLSGYTEDELLGKDSFMIVHPEDREQVGKDVVAMLKGGRSSSFEFRAFNRAGETTWCAGTVNSINYQGKRAALGNFIDITERKQMEQEREQLLQELEDKAKELEQIVYVTSHDLRSPLVNIQGFTRELEQSLKEVGAAMQGADIPPAVSEKLAAPMDEDIPDALKYILASTSKMDTLLSGLLRLSRLGRAALAIKNLDMNKLMADINRAFEFNIREAGVTVEVEDLPSCRGDQTQINQVFSNLIDNTLKFLDPNRPGTIRVSGREEDGHAIFCVEDNGIGIAPEHQEKVFEIFQRLEPGAGSGEGLGLTIVRRILDRHSGKIWLESEPGKGSKFFISLPTTWDIEKGAAK